MVEHIYELILVETGTLYNGRASFRICLGTFKDNELIDCCAINNLFNIDDLPDIKSLRIFYTSDLSEKLENRNRLTR